MFNAVSRERLREIISEKFPTLEAYSDLIYDGKGETFVRLENGQWTVIPVSEGFSQGCPASPVFINYPTRTEQRKALGDTGDDGLGSIGLILAYVDDVNVMLHHDDIEYFLRRFIELGGPLGAILNTEKTRIMTTTSGTSILDKLTSHHDPQLLS
ncbi:hypothetical protein ACHAXN_000070 [Cyclotella atomus]